MVRRRLFDCFNSRLTVGQTIRVCGVDPLDSSRLPTRKWKARLRLWQYRNGLYGCRIPLPWDLARLRDIAAGVEDPAGRCFPEREQLADVRPIKPGFVIENWNVRPPRLLPLNPLRAVETAVLYLLVSWDWCASCRHEIPNIPGEYVYVDARDARLPFTCRVWDVWARLTGREYWAYSQPYRAGER